MNKKENVGATRRNVASVAVYVVIVESPTSCFKVHEPEMRSFVSFAKRIKNSLKEKGSCVVPMIPPD